MTLIHLKKQHSHMSMISGFLSPTHGASSSYGWKNGHQYGGQLRIHSISSPGQLTKGNPPAWWLGEVLTFLHRKKYRVTNRSHRPRTSTDSLVRTQQQKTDMRFGTWNVRSHYRSDQLTAAARELTRHKLDLLCVQQLDGTKGAR